jgi:Glycosyltransferase 61/Methyltransferase domain
MPQDIERFVAWLKSAKRRMAVSDDDLLEMVWQVHPRFRFFKSLPWGANLLDLGAGDGGLVHWKGWLQPQRPDLNLYGVDLLAGAHKDLYAGWESINLDREQPSFPEVKLDAVLANRLIEYLAAPEMIVEWLGTRAPLGARVYLEWGSPSSLDLPTREQLRKFDIHVVASNFMDDWEHKKSPDVSTLCNWLNNGGFTVMASGAIDLGILGEELFARAVDSFTRSMGYWSMTHSSLYAVAVKSHEVTTPALHSAPTIAAAEYRGFDRGRSEAPPLLSSTALDLLRAKRVLLSSGLFDAAFYRETYADIRASTADPLAHYITNGEAEGRSPNPVFWPRYYRRHAMADVPVEQNALAHYAEQGERQRRKPHPAFDPQAYLAANPPLAEFVDRPLFHYLRIGREAGLPVAPGPRGEALARILRAQSHANDFEYSGRRNHYQLMRYKQALVRELGVEDGFTLYKAAFDLPDSDRITRKPLASLYDFAKHHASIFHEIASAGEPFVLDPVARVIGERTCRPLEGVSRAVFVARLDNARIRSRSGFIEVGDVALLDYQGAELARIDDELDFDPAIFHAEGGEVRIIGSQDEETLIDLDEAFMLLGPHSDTFGHWMIDLLPRYIAASASGALPPVPVLIDQNMPATQRECLRLMMPEKLQITDLSPFVTARVRQLWCTPSQMYMPVLERENDRFKWDYFAAPSQRLVTVIREMARRAQPISARPAGQDRVFLARKAFRRHGLANAPDIAAAAAARGFAVLHPEDLSFATQIAMIHHARFVVAPVGSATQLMNFAQPGTRLMILCHPDTVGFPTITAPWTEMGIDITILTGPITRPDEEFPDQSDFRIDEEIFIVALDAWLAGH